MTVVAPNRLIRLPVKNDGTNMPSTCMKMTQWASACGNPQPTMASGDALMMKDIVPNASMPAMTDAMKRGWLAITHSGRGGADEHGRTRDSGRGRDRGEGDEGHDRKDDHMQAENGGIGRKIERHHQIMRHAHEAGADHRSGDAAGRDPRNRLGAVMDRHQFRRGKPVHLQAGYRVAEDEAAGAHDDEVGGV